MGLNGCQKEVLEALKGANGEVVTRPMLVAATGYTDRTIRSAIHFLICDHGIRIETAKTGGYYLPADSDSTTIAKRFFKQAGVLLSRGWKLLRMSEKTAREKRQTTLPFGGEK